MIAINQLPISFVSSEGFKDFMKVIEPNYSIPSRGSIYYRLKMAYNQIREKLSLEISKICSFALTIDAWTSAAVKSYLIVNAHFINDEWMLGRLQLKRKIVRYSNNVFNMRTAGSLLDDITRWNSTLFMCKRLLQNRSAIAAVLADKSVIAIKKAQYLEITEQQWATMDAMIKVLQLLHIATEVLFSDKEVTISMVRPIIRGLLNFHLNINMADSLATQLFKCLKSENVTVLVFLYQNKDLIKF
ncbi:Zinc finger BED domain-containing protein 1 [Trachymyrmex cornetzi]|uniref:Zinc finger BED domain-containing protein 1 n=1 Tax=Trachymyrmex cornetzi TaxID=471704 RepID=A0A151ISJ0_9HYME|nr:Zinc finger BED domain-containing protein 1 [Trachymyrmex cornetzi]